MTSKSNDRNPKITSTFFSFIGKTGEPFFSDEKSNSLGNVQVVISDKKVGVDNTGDGWVDFYRADVRSAVDYYAGGMVMPGRNYNANSYRFGHNTQEKVDEISGNGNHYTAEFWEYDARTVRRWNVDPVVKEGESPYAALSNNPIWFTDPLGSDTFPASEMNSEKWSTFNTDVDVIQIKGIEIIAEKTTTATTQTRENENISKTFHNPTEEKNKSNYIYNSQKAVEFSLNSVGKYTRHVDKSRPITLESKYFDCVGWTHFVLLKTNPQIAEEITTWLSEKYKDKSISKGHIGPTSYMTSYVNAHGGIRKNNPKAGDFAIWTNHYEMVYNVNEQGWVQTVGSNSGTNVPTPRKANFWIYPEHPKMPQMYPGQKMFGYWTPQ